MLLPRRTCLGPRHRHLGAELAHITANSRPLSSPGQANSAIESLLDGLFLPHVSVCIVHDLSRQTHLPSTTQVIHDQGPPQESPHLPQSDEINRHEQLFRAGR